MLNFIKKIVDFVFMKKSTPMYVCANRADQEVVDAIYMDDYMFGDNNSYGEVNSCDNPTCFKDHDGFAKVPLFKSPRCYSIPDNGGVRKESGSYFRGKFIRYVSNYAFQALKKPHSLLRVCSLLPAYSLLPDYSLLPTYNLLPTMAKLLNTVFLKEEMSEEPVNEIDNETDYDFFNKTTDLARDFRVVPKQQEDEELDWVGSSQEVTEEPVNEISDDIDDGIDYDFFNKTTDLARDFQVVPKQQEDDEFDWVGSSKEVAQQQENDELDTLVRDHSLRYPMEEVMVGNLRYYPGLLRTFVCM